MKPEYVVGEVGFGPNLDFQARAVDAMPQIEMLEAQVARLIKDRNVLRRALERCAALSADVSDEKHEALLATAP